MVNFPAVWDSSTDGQSSAPLPRYRWLILALTWTAFLVGVLARLSIGPLGPFLKEGFRISNTQIGWLGSASMTSYAPALLIAGWVVDRIGVRWMLVAGTSINGLCSLAVFFAPSYEVMFAILVVSGVGMACIFPAAIKVGMLWFPPRERGTALGFNQMSMNAGGLICASVLPPIAVAFGWRYGFLLLAFVALIATIFCAAKYRDPPRQTPLPTADTQVDGPSRRQLLLRVLKSRDIWVLASASLCLSIVEFAVMTHLVLYLKESLLFGAVVAGGLLAMTQAAGAFGKLASGFISDRFMGSRRKVVFVFMAAATSVMCLVLAASGANPGWLLYPALIILGVMAIGWGGLYATMAGELGGREMAGAVSGTANALTCLGALSGPPLFGYIVDSTGSYRTAWLVMLIFGVGSVVLGSLIREHKS